MCVADPTIERDSNKVNVYRKRVETFVMNVTAQTQ